MTVVTRKRAEPLIPVGKRRCFRCKGQKKMFKLHGGYAMTNFGGKEVDCPMCLGKGIIDKIEAVIEKGKEILEEVEVKIDKRSKAYRELKAQMK